MSISEILPAADYFAADLLARRVSLHICLMKSVFCTQPPSTILLNLTHRGKFRTSKRYFPATVIFISSSPVKYSEILRRYPSTKPQSPKMAPPSHFPRSLGQNMVRVAGIFQGLIALPIMLTMGWCVFEYLFDTYYNWSIYNFVYVSSVHNPHST
jgi:hypothetical protein